VDAMNAIKPVNFIIVTDGESSNLQNRLRYNHILTSSIGDDPRPVIMTAARRLDRLHAPLTQARFCLHLLGLPNMRSTQVGIQFVQIGTDPRATAFLKELDDDLQGAHDIRVRCYTNSSSFLFLISIKQDIVDTTPYDGLLSAETLIKALLGGINRRVDQKGGRSVL
jgi:hypothetical protein